MTIQTEGSATSRLGVDQVAAAVAAVPAFSAAVRRVMDACDDPDSSVQDVADALLADQGLTANVLRLANSAHYGHGRRINTVTEAVLLVGFTSIRSLAITSHTSKVLSRPLPGYAMGRGDLWRHSMSVAFVSRRLAAETRSAPMEVAFVAGLLHDVGKVILSDLMRESFEQMTSVAHDERIPLAMVEQRLLGFDHADLGARLAEAWEFPAALTEAIGTHHRPGDATVAPQLAHCVHVADLTCLFIGAGAGASAVPYGVDPTSFEAIGITPRRLIELAGEMEPILIRDLEAS